MRAAKNRVHPLVGCLFRKMAITYRVLAVCDNYAMMRAKGYAPFCVYVKDLERDYFKEPRKIASDWGPEQAPTNQVMQKILGKVKRA